LAETINAAGFWRVEAVVLLAQGLIEGSERVQTHFGDLTSHFFELSRPCDGRRKGFKG
jgi:hypothetical protein